MSARQDRIDALKSRLADIDGWLDTHRGQQRELVQFERNRETAMKLRRELLKLRDPELHARLYPTH